MQEDLHSQNIQSLRGYAGGLCTGRSSVFQEVITGIQEIAGMNEYDILLCICQENDITGLERVVRNRKVDGIVLLRTFLKDPQIELLLEKKIPFVTTGSTTYRKVKQVDNDQQSACRELTSIY